MSLSTDYWLARIVEVEADLDRARVSPAPSRALDVLSLQGYLGWLRGMCRAAQYRERPGEVG